MKIALTGGIACGKSTLAKFLRELGICLLDADDVVHELEGPDGEAVEPILKRFPTAREVSCVSSTDGVNAERNLIDRKRLAEIVFNDPAARKDLENILFPMVRARLLAFVNDQSQDSDFENSDAEFKISIIPLLFESHWERDYDIILAIASSEREQIERMMVTRGYTREHAKARLAAQMPIAEKIRRADYVITNESTPEHLRDEAGRLLSWLKERKKYEH